MGRALWIADRCREFGLRVVEVDGWRSRGSSSFNPSGVVCHHTAGGPTGDLGSMRILVSGRSDLPGPLCHVGFGRSGTVYVIASGRANHAGTGGWRGLSGNSSVLGIEAENNGSQSWTPEQLRLYPVLAAALISGAGGDVSKVCAHREWTRRKPDPHSINMDNFRANVQKALNSRGVTPAPPPPPAPSRPRRPRVVGIATTPSGHGYWEVADDGGVFNYGDAHFYGSVGGRRLNAPVVGIESTKSGNGYWLVAADGGVFGFGDALFFGSTGGLTLAKPVTGIRRTASGLGYWLVAADGGVFAFGDAGFNGSPAVTANPSVGLAADSKGGYWIASSSGKVFSHGTGHLGDAASAGLNKPIVAILGTPSGAGYHLVASDGGVFSYGDATFHGSTGDTKLVQPITSAASTPSGKGYLLVAADGGVFAFGDATYHGNVSEALTQAYGPA